MMTIREIIDLARITSLGSYALKDDDDAIVKILNFSMSQVYNKIPALTQFQTIPLVVNKTRYDYLDVSYRPISVVTECGKPLVINDDTNKFSLFDMGNHILDIPLCVQKLTNNISILLQIKPPKVTCSNLDIIDFAPDDALVPSILSYMAYMVSKNISEENGVGHLNEFMQSIEEVKRLGLYVTYNHSMDLPFYRNGWE